jgi:hypothetical protein
MFMTYSASCCLVTKSWIHGMYVCDVLASHLVGVLGSCLVVPPLKAAPLWTDCILMA